jgi:hypothetical protein
MRRVNVPLGVADVVCTFSAEVPGLVRGFGVNVTVELAGAPATDSDTEPLKPPLDARETV